MNITRWWKHAFVLFLFSIAAVVSGCNCEPSEIGNNSELTASPKSLEYDAVQGESQTKTVVITAKVGSIIINTIELRDGAPHYSIEKESMPTLPHTMSQGDTLSLKITYKAPAGAAISGLVRIESDAATPTDGVLDIRMLARVNTQYLVFKPNPVSFGEVLQGKSKTIEVVGENQGRATLKIDQIKWNENSSKGFTFPDGAPKAPKELKPGETFKFKVMYKPTGSKIDQGQLEFTCPGGCAPDDPDPILRKNPYPLRFNGTLAAPSIEVTPLSIDFGFVTSGTKASKNVRIANVGSAPLTISKISMQEKSSGAFIVPRLVDVVIEPGKSKELPVSFQPTTGSKHEGVIVIKSDDPNKPEVLVRLFGKVSAPNIEVQPRLLDYGKAPVAKTLAFTVANSGDRPLEVKSIVLVPGTSPEFKIELGSIKFPWTLTPNKFQSISVVYTPANEGADVGRIQVVSNDPDEPTIEIELKATGSSVPNCDLAPVPSRLNFGLSVIGKSKVIPVKWTNQGGKDCEISAMTIVTDRGGFPFPYNGPDVYHLPKPPAGCTGKDGKYTCSPAIVVKPGNSLLTDVSFFPLTEKQTTPLSSPNFTGSLEMQTNGKPSNPRVILDGLATKSCVEVVPDNVDFGLITLNCSSQNEKITIYNTCAQAITVNKIGFSSTGANGFRITKAQATPFTIPAGQSGEVEVAYRATAPARRQNAVLQIEHTLKQQSPLSVPMIAEGTTTAEQTDTFKQLKNPKIDILFVIDNSCSMGDEQASMATNFASFIKWAKNLSVDFQIGVTTTDDGTSPIGPQAVPGELVGPAGQKFLTSATPNIEASFNQRVRVGTGGGGKEAGLNGAKAALSHPLITTGVNKGFLRQDASLSIIVLSDEPDQSTQPAQFYINFFKNIKGYRNPDLLRFNAVIGIDEKTLQPKCGSGGSNSGATSNGRYLSVVQATRGLVASICSNNWSSTLSRIGAVTFGLKKQFLLSRIADPKSIVVKVNGKVVAKGTTTWDYSTQDNSVNFVTSPPASATIEVKYKAICF